VKGAPVTVPAIHAFLERTYSNSTYILPDFNSLSGYVSDHSGTQVPVLSYASDGVFYINSSDDLVYFSFPNDSVRLIAPWDMLYDQIGYVGELNNYFYLTFDGTYAYELGCATSGCGGCLGQLCGSSDPLIEYAVNISTGRSFTWNTSILQGSTAANAGVNLVGRDGNDSLMALLTSDGTIRLYDPWNGTAWIAGRFAYFEANNAYWVPFLNSYIDIQAQGSSADDIEQLELVGHGSGTSFVPVFGPARNGPGGVITNGVSGLAFNLTLNEMAYNYGSAASGNVLTVYAIQNGVLTGMASYRLDKKTPYGLFVADDHRLSVTTGAPLVSEYYDPDFYNRSWVINPFSGQFYDTNVQQGYPTSPGSNEFDGAAGYDGEPAHQFLNASSAITAYSVNCANATGGATPCPLLGTTPGTKLGTVYYISELPAGQFPYPSSAPIAQSGPPPPLVLSASSTRSTIRVTWEAPSVQPILNFTFYWGDNRSMLIHHVNLASSARAFTISGLRSGEVVYFGVTANDLNYVSPLEIDSGITTTPPPASDVVPGAEGPRATVEAEPVALSGSGGIPMDRSEHLELRERSSDDRRARVTD
jgi:hypothetical protein